MQNQSGDLEARIEAQLSAAGSALAAGLRRSSFSNKTAGSFFSGIVHLRKDAVLLLLLIAPLFALFLVASRSRRARYSFYNLRGPPNTSLILGHISNFVGISVGANPVSWLSTHGLTHRIHLALSQPALLSADKAALSYILRNVDIFPKQKPLRRQLARYLDEGIVVAEGDTHRRQKRMLASSFAPGMIREFGPLFMEQSERLREKWIGIMQDRVSPDEDAEGVRKVDVLNDVMSWSMDVIGQAGFGHDMGGLAEKRNELALAFEASVRNFGRISPMWVLQSMIPFFDYIPNPVTYQMNANKADTRRLSRAIFDEKRREVLEFMTPGGKHAWGKDILSNLLRANMSSSIDEKERLPDEEVVAQIGTLLLAGKANTAFAATWLLYELALHQDVQDRLRSELQSMSNPDSQTLASLPYLEAVIREALRLHPSVPQTMRVSTRDTIIPLDKPMIGRDGEMIREVELPKGTIVLIPIAYANRSVELWGPDANTFNPDRFLVDQLSKDQTHTHNEGAEGGKYEGAPGMWGQLLTFIDGPRGCLGYRFALAEIRALIHVLLRAFIFEPVEGVEITSWYAIKNQPVVRGKEKEGMQLSLRIRPVH